MFTVSTIEGAKGIFSNDEPWLGASSIETNNGQVVFQGYPAETLEGEFLESYRYAFVAWPSSDAATSYFAAIGSEKESSRLHQQTFIRKTGLFTPANGALPKPAARAYILAFAQIVDYRPELANYRDAIVDLLPEYDARYLLIGRPESMLEGDWRQRLSMAVIEFPNLDAAATFWKSARYQNEIKPMRAGTGVFDVAVFETS